MNSAYECSVKFDKDGKLRERRRSIGGIVVWAIVVLVIVYSGRSIATVPPALWGMLRRLLP